MKIESLMPKLGLMLECLTAFLINAAIVLCFSFLLGCNNDDDVIAPPDDTTTQDPGDTVDDEDNPNGTTDDTPEIGDYLALKALYEANPDNELGWNMDDTSMESWDGVVLSNERVTHLEVSNKKVGLIVPEIGNLEKLLILNLNANIIVELPEEIARLLKLRELHLEKNSFKELPTQIGSLKSLEALYLASNPLEKLPTEIGGLYNLKKLAANFCNALKELPAEIGNLSVIEELDFSYNSTLAELPEKIGELTTLKFLDIKGTDIVGLPKKVCDLTVTGTIIEKEAEIFCHDTLEADHYALMSLLDANPGLEAELNWDRNALPTDLWDGITLDMGKVNAIDITYRLNFKLIPNEIQYLSKLKSLHLDLNQINSIDEGIGKLSELTYLSLGQNDLMEIPENIGNLDQLKILYLYNNNLTTIPDSFGNLEQLKILSLIVNDLKSIPDSLGNLDQLMELGLINNNLTSIPQSVCDLERYGQLTIYKDVGVICE